MPESPIRVYLPEKRPADVRPRQPHWFSAEVSAAVLTQLQNIGPTANWNEAINAIALAATGRYAPVIGDIVTLHRGTDSFRREWNGFRWIYIEPYLDGDNIYIESLLANTLSGDIDADRIRAKNVTTPLLLANSFEGGKWESNALFADHVRTDRTIIDESVQVGLGTISFDNLSDEIIAPVSVSQTYSINYSFNAQTGPEERLVPSAGENLRFTRNGADENISLHFHASLTLRRGFFPGIPDLYFRVYTGTNQETSTAIRRTIGVRSVAYDPNTLTARYGTDSLTVPIANSPISQERIVFIEVYAAYFIVRQGYFPLSRPLECLIRLTAILQEARPFG